ncbi:MAG: PIN domain-containing protein, partial [Bacteroidota bacterium]
FLEDQDIEVLPISNKNISTYINLPLHHRDPFDRMIIVQAIEENLSILGPDEVFDQYAINCDKQRMIKR